MSSPSSPTITEGSSRGSEDGLVAARQTASLGYLGRAGRGRERARGQDGMMWAGPGIGMPLQERNCPDDLFPDNDWSSSSRPSRTGWLSGVARWAGAWAGGQGRACGGALPEAPNLFALDEPLLPLLDRPARERGCCGWQCLAEGGVEEARRRPRLWALCCLALALVFVVCATFTTQLIQLSVSSSSLSFVAVNITLPSPPTQRFRRHRAAGDSARIGFDSMVHISAPALWLWPWAARVGGGNFTLDFSLHPGIGVGGDSGGDGRFVPCAVGTLVLPPIALTGGRASFDMPISGGVLSISPQEDCFRGFTRGMLLADKLWLTLRGTVNVQVYMRIRAHVRPPATHTHMHTQARARRKHMRMHASPHSPASFAPSLPLSAQFISPPHAVGFAVA